MKRKILSFCLVIAMVISTFSGLGSIAFAADEATPSVYRLTDSLKDGGEYLIVNINNAGSGYALAYDRTGTNNVGSDSVTVKSDGSGLYVDTSDVADGSVWTATAKGEGFDLTTSIGGVTYYLEAYSSSNQAYINNPQHYPDRYWLYNSNSNLYERSTPSSTTSSDGSIYNHFLNYSGSSGGYWGGSSGFAASSSTSNTSNDRVYIYEKSGASASEKTLSSITLSGMPRNFNVGSTFSTSGLTVTANYSDGTTAVVTDYTVNSSAVNMNAAGTYTVTVSYQDRTATYSVTVTGSSAPAGSDYYLTDSLKDGNDYLIVNVNNAGSGYALAYDRSGTNNVGRTSVTVVNEGGRLLIRESSVTSNNVITASEKAAGLFDLTLTASGTTYYLEAYSSSNQVYLNSTQKYPDRSWIYNSNHNLYENSTRESSTSSDGTLYNHFIRYNNGFVADSSGSSTSSYYIYIYEKAGTSAEKVLDRIGVSGAKTSFTVGNTFSTSGLVVTAYYTDGTSRTISGYSVNSSSVNMSRAGTYTVTVTYEGKTASYTVTVAEKQSGQVTNIAVTSDVHSQVSRLGDFLDAVQADYDPDLERVLFCGDMVNHSEYNLTNYLNDYNSAVSTVNSKVGVNAGIYTTGNHDQQISGCVTELEKIPGFVRIGEAANESNYIVYCMGAYRADGTGSFPDDDIAQLEAYLNSAPTDIPIFILSHYPLHYISSRTITNASRMIDVLNEHSNAVFFWGHNHSQGDSHYGQVVKAGGTIQYTSSASKTINFTYACAGGMRSESETHYSGVVLTISPNGDQVDFQYYSAGNKAPYGTSTTVTFGGSSAPQKILQSITVSGAPTSFTAGSTFSYSGLVVTANYSDGTTANVSGYSVNSNSVNMNAAGTYTVTVTYQGKSATYTVTVVNAQTEGTAYYLTNTLRDGGEYLIVNTNNAGTGYALSYDRSGTNNVGRTSVIVVNDGGQLFIRDNGISESAVVKASAKSNGHDLTITVNGTKYYVEAYSGSNQVYINATQTYPDRSWIYNSNHNLYENSTKESTTASDGSLYNHFMVYNNGFSAYSTHDDTYTSYIYLYEKVESSTTCRHTALVRTAATAATCTAAGNSEYYTCSNCGKFFSDSAATNEIAENSWVISALGHDYELNRWNWTSNYGSATATFVCANNSMHTVTVNASVSMSTTAATCTAAGETVYTATAVYDNVTYTDKVTVAIPATDHDYKFDSFVWSEDGTTAQAKLVCANDASHVAYENAVMSSVEYPATVDEDAYTVYTATYGDATQTNTVVSEGTAIGHDYDAQFTWNDDNTATAAITDKNDPSYSATIPADVTSETTPATCEEDGIVVYTATVTVGSQTFSSKREEVIPAIGHNYSEPALTWGEDGYVTVTFKCQNPGDDKEVEFETAYETSIIPATCEEDGQVVYSVKFKFEGKEYNESYVAKTVPAIGHAYAFDSFVWSEDGTTAGAKLICANDASHITYEDAVMSSADYPATAEKDAYTVYTATYGDETDTNTVVFEGTALGHDYVAEFTWTDDYKATVKFTDNNDPDFSSVVEAEIKIETTPATSAAEGKTVYTAFVTGPDGETYTDAKIVVIPKLDNDFVASFTWNDDNTVIVTVTDNNDPDFIESIPATVTIATTSATCEEEGKTQFTATAQYEGMTFTDTKTVAIPATGHDYRFDSFIWSEDGTKAQVKLVCENDASHVKYEDAEVSSETVAATAETDAYTVYTATYGEETDTNTVVDEDTALGHDYVAQFNWTDDNSAATATFTDNNDPEFTSTVAAQVTTANTPATSAAEGKTEYTATVEGPDGKTYTDTKVVVLPRLEPDYEFVGFEWSDDSTSAQVIVKDKNNNNATVKLNIPVTIHEEPATCTVNASTVYTAVFLEHSESKTVMKTGTATGHIWDDGVITKPATVSSEGIKTYTCTVCKETKTEVIAKIDFMLGDVNLDGEISAEDARLALRQAVKLEHYAPDSQNFINADVNFDKSVTADDARSILRAAVKLENPADWLAKMPKN